MADEVIEEGGDEGAEFLPEVTSQPKDDVYTLLMGLTVAAFVVGIGFVAYECWLNYDVQFLLFKK